MLSCEDRRLEVERLRNDLETLQSWEKLYDGMGTNVPEDRDALIGRKLWREDNLRRLRVIRSGCSANCPSAVQERTCILRAAA
jgi:hypothetical protein